MSKQIVKTILWAFFLFLLLGLIKYFLGIENWMGETFDWVMPSVIGYFFGYWQSRIDNRR